MTEERGFGHGDREMLRAAATGEGTTPITSRKQLEGLRRAVTTRKTGFDIEFADMSPDHAEFVRRLRVEEGFTWRAIAETCALEWGGNWGGNQIAGMAICERAASYYGEDYMRGHWNG